MKKIRALLLFIIEKYSYLKNLNDNKTKIRFSDLSKSKTFIFGRCMNISNDSETERNCKSYLYFLFLKLIRCRSIKLIVRGSFCSYNLNQSIGTIIII